MRKVTKPKNEKLPATIGGRIGYVRRNALVSQDDVAALLGITRNHLCMIESNKRNPTADMVKSLSVRFSVPSDFLLCLSDVASLDIDTQAISKQLGLSETAQASLKAMCVGLEELNTLAVTYSEAGAFYKMATQDREKITGSWEALGDGASRLKAINIMLTSETGLSLLRLLNTLFLSNETLDSKTDAFAKIIDMLSQLRHSQEVKVGDVNGDN